MDPFDEMAQRIRNEFKGVYEHHLLGELMKMPG